MNYFKDLFLNKDEQSETTYEITISSAHSREYYLLSWRFKNGYKQFYLFNRIKIFQIKEKQDIQKCEKLLRRKMMQ